MKAASAECAAMHAQGAVAVEGEAILWKPSASSSLWDVRRLPSLPEMGMGPALNRSSSFEYESTRQQAKRRRRLLGRDDGAKGRAACRGGAGLLLGVLPAKACSHPHEISRQDVPLVVSSSCFTAHLCK